MTTNIATQSALPSLDATGVVPSGLGFGGSGISFLTPDALMAYCEDKLSDTDKQINNLFTSESQNETSTSAITAVQTLLNSNTQGIGNGNNGAGPDPSTCNTIEAAYQTAIDATTNPQVKAELVSALKSFQSCDGNTNDAVGGVGNSGFYGNVAATDVANAVTKLQGIASDASNSSQLIMIQLQSLTSQRQTVVSSCTGMIQGLDDSLKEVADKIGS